MYHSPAENCSACSGVNVASRHRRVRAAIRTAPWLFCRPIKKILMQASTAIAQERSGGTDMRRSIAMLLCFFPALVSQSAGATSYLVHRKFEPGCDDQSKRCSHYRCSSAHMDFPRDIPPACQRSFEPRIFGAVAFAGRIDPPDSESHRQSSAVSRVAQTDTAKPNPPEGPPQRKPHRRPVMRQSPSGTRRCWDVWRGTTDTQRKPTLPRGWSVSLLPSIGRATS